MKNFGVSQAKFDQLLGRMQSLGLAESDIEEKFTTSSGPGGQNVNKVATCVHLKHSSTGIEVKMQKARTQAMNRFYARRRLCELLEEQTLGQESPTQKQYEKIRKQKQRRKRRSKI
jgi:protein subunit release factor B